MSEVGADAQQCIKGLLKSLSVNFLLFSVFLNKFRSSSVVQQLFFAVKM